VYGPVPVTWRPTKKRPPVLICEATFIERVSMTDSEYPATFSSLRSDPVAGNSSSLLVTTRNLPSGVSRAPSGFMPTWMLRPAGLTMRPFGRTPW